MAMSCKERKQAQRSRASGYALSRETSWRSQGITDASYADYLAKLESQNCQCAICKCSINASSAYDHNHASGLSRGILCMNCNVLLGKMECGGRRFIENAPAYLEQWGS
jgi:hypothetical protein